ncbi:trace amine-associated receptor 13c-like [Hypomesus transpacificus]|uniref:trace amine-associated receptor 13c-like n=1 Tax=Hypomesus transpacificus TaxID=137520 RepID=UPI001F072308|nr:trace amine-associated receptor 13c-like [Hypomesus transpacificus]
MQTLPGEEEIQDFLSCQLNTSCQTQVRSRNESALVYTALSFVSLLTVLLNMLVLISISHFRQLHTPTNVLIFSLALADLLVGAQMIPMEMITRSNPCWYLGRLMCYLVPYASGIFTCSSIWNLALISVDRYIAVCEPLLYPSRVTMRRTILFSVLNWICSIIYSGCIMMDHMRNVHVFDSCTGLCVVIFLPYSGIVDLLVSFLCPCCVIVVLYIKIFTVAISQARSIKSNSLSIESDLMKTSKSEKKAAKTLSTVIVVYLLCFAPYYCSSLSDNWSSQIVTMWIYEMNSCLNPLIYAFFYPWFKKSVKCIITLKILQPFSSELSLM